MKFQFFFVFCLGFKFKAARHILVTEVSSEKRRKETLVCPAATPKKNMLATRRNHGSMGRMFSASVVARSMAARVNLAVPTPASDSSSSSSSSESCYSSVGESEAWESSRAEVAQRIAPPQRRGNITSSNGLVLPWANGAGFSIVTTSSTRIPAITSSSTTTPSTVPPAPPKPTPGQKKQKKRPGLPVSLNAIAEDFCRGMNPVGFVVQNPPPGNVGVVPTMIPSPPPPRGNGYERAQVQAMLTEQRTNAPASSSSSSASSSSSSSTEDELRSSGKRSPISKKTPPPRKSRKRMSSSSSPRHTNTGNPSSNEDIAEDEFFRREGSDSSGSSSGSSSDDDGRDSDSRRPNLYRARRRRGRNTPPPAEPAEPLPSSLAPSVNLCFGCMWGHRQFDRVASTKLNRLAEIFDGHFLTSEPRELAHLIHLYYQAEIYLPGSKGGKRFPEWTEDQILIHIEEHILEPRVFVAKSIRKCIKVQRALEMFFFEEDEETRRRTFNEKAMKLWLTFNKRQMDLHNCDCKHMFGYSESMKIDPSQLSRVVHADRYEVTSSNKRGRANVYS